MLVGKHMTPKPITVTPDDRLGDAQKKMHDGNFRCLPVTVGEELLGVLTDRDLRPYLGHLEHTKVNAAMTEDPLTVTPQTSLEEAAKQLLEHKIGALPVMENKKLTGIITTSDLLEAFLDVMGASAEGTARLDLLIEGEDQSFAGASQIIEAAGSELLGVGTHREQWNKGPVFYVRIRAKDPEAIGKALEKEGYSVLGIQT